MGCKCGEGHFEAKSAEQGSSVKFLNVPIAKDSPLVQEFDRLQTAVDRIGETVQRLEQKLIPVTRPTPTCESNSNARPLVSSSPMGLKIDGVSNKIDSINEKIELLLTNNEL